MSTGSDTFMKEKPIFPLLMSMALPMVLSMAVNSLYNIVDSYFVAKISEDAMAALSLVFPIQNFINAVAIGFGVGINALISTALGAGKQEEANRAATHGMALSLLHGVILMIAAIAVMPAFLRMFTDNETVISMGVTYSTIVFLFSTVIMADLCYEKLFQAVGRMTVTMSGLIVGAVTNMILDPIMIFGIGPCPEMGIAGAALATGIGQAATLLVYLGTDHARPLSVRIGRKYLVRGSGINGRLYGIGIPAILNLALPSLMISSLNRLLAVYSQSYVVILGIYYKLQTFLYLSANGLIQGMRPIIGYNYGAGEHDRVQKIYFLTLKLAAGIMAVGTVGCLICARPLIGLFTDTPETVAAGAHALRIISAGFVVSSVSVTSSGALEGVGKGAHSLAISLSRYLIVILPAAWLLSRFLGADGVWHAFWITEAATALIAGAVCRRSLR